jgi:hypothetical protein
VFGLALRPNCNRTSWCGGSGQDPVQWPAATALRTPAGHEDVWTDAGGGTRTRTELSLQRILSSIESRPPESRPRRIVRSAVRVCTLHPPLAEPVAVKLAVKLFSEKDHYAHAYNLRRYPAVVYQRFDPGDRRDDRTWVRRCIAQKALHPPALSMIGACASPLRSIRRVGRASFKHVAVFPSSHRELIALDRARADTGAGGCGLI